MCASDRIQQSNIEIMPVLNSGAVVICDRYYYSGLANLLARGYTDDLWIYEISRYVPKPDASFILDADVNTAIKRIRSRVQEKDRYIDVDLQYRLRENYIKIADENDGVFICERIGIDWCFEIVKEKVEGVLKHV
jgi:dTMP kinase